MKASLIALSLLASLSLADAAYAQTITTVYSDAFLGSQVNTDFWRAAGSTTLSQSELNVQGNGNYGSNGVASLSAYSRVNSDLIFDTDLSVSNCSATATSAVLGYGDVDPFSAASNDYLASVVNGTVVLQTYQNGSLEQQVSTGYVCSSNAPFHIKLVALSIGGAELFINGSTTPAATTADGTFASKQIFLQAYQPGATASFSNFLFSFLPESTPVTGTGSGTSGTSGVGTGVGGTTGTAGATTGTPGATTGTSGATKGTTVLVGGGSPLSPDGGIVAGNAFINSINPVSVSGVSATQPTDANSATVNVGSGSGAPAATTQGPTGLIPCGYTTMCTFSDLVTLAQNFINLLITLSVAVATISIAYAGYLYMTSAGDSGKVSKATEIFTNVVVGFIIVLAAWIIVHTILYALIGSSTPV